MTLLVNKAYIDAKRQTAQDLDSKVRERFHGAYGAKEGDRKLDAMISRMQENIASDSSDPAKTKAAKSK